MGAHVWWSIYVRAPEPKLREAHLPPIPAALETIDFDWDISAEPRNVYLFRLVTCQNFENGPTHGSVRERVWDCLPGPPAVSCCARRCRSAQR
jgi:hypothetical protein